MRTLKLTLLLAALAIAGNVGYGQEATKPIPQEQPKSQMYIDSMKSISNLRVYIGNGISSGKQSKEALLEKPFLVAKDFSSGTQWNIVSYQAVFVVNGKEELPIAVSGTEFPEPLIAKIQSAKSGTIIEFSDIKAKSSTGTQFFQNPIVIRIQ